MASSRKSNSNSIYSKAKHALSEQVHRGDRLIAALSGGVDSVVLLDLLVALSVEMRFTLSAIHIDHGISINAGRWSQFCRDLCRAQGVPLETVRLKISREAGISLEAAARDARYRAFSKLSGDYVVLAQHLDDQAETLLLQLLRGAGVKGLGAMPAVRGPKRLVSYPVEKNGKRILDGEGTPSCVHERKLLEGPQILRPMLGVSRREIEYFARARGLEWVTDESNDDLAFARNFLRHEFLPILEKRFPSYRTAFQRVSRHLAEASLLLDELAAFDLQGCVFPGRVQTGDLRALSFPRGRNLLRYIIARQGVVLPSTAKLEEMLRQLRCARLDSNLHIVFGSNEIRCYKGVVYVRTTAKQHGSEWRLEWHGEDQLVIGELGGTMRFKTRKGSGINLQKLMEGPVTIRLRRGGERLQPDCRRPRRSLKKLLQEAALPPWEREALPLLFGGEHLVWAPGFGIDCAFQAEPGEMALTVEWVGLGGKTWA
jgi:tRNA(Ile)-lysidine synthase